MNKIAKTVLTLAVDEQHNILSFNLESNMVEPDRRLILLDAYVDLASKNGLGFGDMAGELMIEAKKMQNGRRKNEKIHGSI